MNNDKFIIQLKKLLEGKTVMNNDKFIIQLKKLLEGKTVKQVLSPEASEAVCKLILTDGTAFRIHATDLGSWIEETVITNGIYKSLDQLIKDYHHHEYPKGYDCIDPDVSFYEQNGKNIIKFNSPYEAEFKIYESNLTEWEKKIIEDDIGIKLLKEAFHLGDCWRILFGKNSDICPKELIYNGQV